MPRKLNLIEYCEFRAHVLACIEARKKGGKPMGVPKVRMTRRIAPVMHAKLDHAVGQTVCRQKKHGGRITDDRSKVDCAVCLYILNKPPPSRNTNVLPHTKWLRQQIEHMMRLKSNENHHS